MKRTENIITVITAVLIAGLLSSCVYDEGTDPVSDTPISVNTAAVEGSRVGGVADNTFMLLLWEYTNHLSGTTPNDPDWLNPYYSGQAPQPVTFYNLSVFDTRYPYPMPQDQLVYATGYAPGDVLNPDRTVGFSRLTSSAAEADKGRYDYLGCDSWPEVYRGSLMDPFAQEKNKLYFRHLSSKLVIIADRDKETMENKQYVRNVQVRHLRMSIDGGQTWTPMYTPSAFEWQPLTAGDITASYREVIDAVKLVEGNTGVTTDPAAGYKAVEATTFSGESSDFVLEKGSTDRVPVRGMIIDSCFVCNPITDGVVQVNQPIKLKMDISAQMSFDPDFPDASENFTFTREYNNVVLDAIYHVEIGADGKPVTTREKISLFKPGNEYRIYIHFSLSGVNLVAREVVWGFGGIHYITIVGSDPKTPETP